MKRETKKKIKDPEFVYESTEDEQIRKNKETGEIISKKKYSRNVKKFRKFVKDTGHLGV